MRHRKNFMVSKANTEIHTMLMSGIYYFLSLKTGRALKELRDAILMECVKAASLPWPWCLVCLQLRSADNSASPMHSHTLK